MNLLQQKLAYAKAHSAPLKRTDTRTSQPTMLLGHYQDQADPVGMYECLMGHELDARLSCPCDRR